MGLREIFTGDELDRYEREAKAEAKFQNKLEGALRSFRRQGRQLFMDGEMAGLRELYIDAAVGPAMEDEDRQLEVLGDVDDELRSLIAEYDVDLDDNLYADI